MKIYLECLIVEEGKAHRFRFLVQEIPANQFDATEHWSVNFDWMDMEKEVVEGSWEKGYLNYAVINCVRVWKTAEFTPEEREFLIKEGKIGTLTDLPKKTEVTYDGNKPNGSSL